MLQRLIWTGVWAAHRPMPRWTSCSVAPLATQLRLSVLLSCSSHAVQGTSPKYDSHSGGDKLGRDPAQLLKTLVNSCKLGFVLQHQLPFSSQLTFGRQCSRCTDALQGTNPKYDSHSGGDKLGRDPAQLLKTLVDTCKLDAWVFCHLTSYTVRAPTGSSLLQAVCAVPADYLQHVAYEPGTLLLVQQLQPAGLPVSCCTHPQRSTAPSRQSCNLHSPCQVLRMASSRLP